MNDEPLVLVGHSFGGCIATVIAATNPELVAALVLAGAPLIRTSPTAKPPWRYRAIRFFRTKGLVSEEKLASARQRYGSADYRHAKGLLRDVLVATVNESYEEELVLVRAPVAMVWGELDREVPASVASRAGALLHTPHTFRSVAGVGHLLPTEAPHELVTSTFEVLS
jgi:pimeloyl-ACP methyl ester carboxylesterase